MKTNFNAGDIVRIKSGGPCMTVTAVSTVSAYNYEQPEFQRVWVVWFDAHNKMQSEELRNFYLEIAE